MRHIFTTAVFVLLARVGISQAVAILGLGITAALVRCLGVGVTTPC
jgi:hypothetical protein